jgi:YihY family inner membrane protein
MIAAMNRRQLWRDLSRFPWRNTAAVLGERFREDRLGLTASSLTFTTTIAMVPFFTVALALFTVFPMFAKMQGRLQRWLIESLIPENISRQVLGYLNQFANKASGLGIAGLIVLLITAIALILTIDKTLNNIWRVRTPRPFAQRVFIYWAAITLGPVILAVSLSTTSSVVSATSDVVGRGMVKLFFDTFEFALLAVGMASLYHYVPNTNVRWSHAMGGRHLRGRGHRDRQARAGLLPEPGADLLGRVRRLRHLSDPAGVDLRGLGDRAARRGHRGLPAEPADGRGAARRRRRLAAAAGHGNVAAPGPRAGHAGQGHGRGRTGDAHARRRAAASAGARDAGGARLDRAAGRGARQRGPALCAAGRPVDVRSSRCSPS